MVGLEYSINQLLPSYLKSKFHENFKKPKKKLSLNVDLNQWSANFLNRDTPNLKNTRHTSQVSFIFFAPNLVFLVINELNLWLYLTQNSDINTIESFRHFSRHSKKKLATHSLRITDLNNNKFQYSRKLYFFIVFKWLPQIWSANFIFLVSKIIFLVSNLLIFLISKIIFLISTIIKLSSKFYWKNQQNLLE